MAGVLVGKWWGKRFLRRMERPWSLQDDFWSQDDPKMLPKSSRKDPKMTPKYGRKDNHELVITRIITMPWSAWYDSHHLIIRVWPSWHHHRDMIKHGWDRKTFLTQALDRFRSRFCIPLETQNCLQPKPSKTCQHQFPYTSDSKKHASLLFERPPM